MKSHFLLLAFVFSLLLQVQPATAQKNDAERDILVTFDNQGARMHSTGMSAPYRNRKRYSIAAAARRSADEVRDEYALIEVDHWPIRSLSIYCFVYRVPSGEDREALIDRLKSDARIESVQALQKFETGTSANVSGGPEPLTPEDARSQLGDAVDLVIDGGRCPGGRPSTVVDCTVAPARIVRESAISREELVRAAGAEFA